MSDGDVQNPSSKQLKYDVSLGGLHDSILVHILSSIATSEVLRTSILSTRWRFLWTAMPNLEFDEFDEANVEFDEFDEANMDADPDDRRQSFLDIVPRVLQLHDSSDLSKFVLCCNVQDDGHVINAWIGALVEKNVKDLLIKLRQFNQPFELPDCLFTCESLTKFALKMEQPLKLRSSNVRFSNLKVLKLEKVTFVGEDSTNKLFAACPLLEELCLGECSWGDLKMVIIPCPRLSKLLIVHDDSELDRDGCMVVIPGKNLERFEFASRFINEFISSDQATLAYSYIQFWGEGEEDVDKLVMLFMKFAESVKWLVFNIEIQPMY